MWGTMESLEALVGMAIAIFIMEVIINKDNDIKRDIKEKVLSFLLKAIALVSSVFLGNELGLEGLVFGFVNGLAISSVDFFMYRNKGESEG